MLVEQHQKLTKCNHIASKGHKNLTVKAVTWSMRLWSPLKVGLGSRRRVEVVLVQRETGARRQQDQPVNVVELSPAHRLAERHVALYITANTGPGSFKEQTVILVRLGSKMYMCPLQASYLFSSVRASQRHQLGHKNCQQCSKSNVLHLSV